ncbi:hypothetical protein EDB19DRAFT_226060 [Suillus lakei]|nr:hypothetical protein EDB19DRAFT_226060 [Suillus lakei]
MHPFSSKPRSRFILIFVLIPTHTSPICTPPIHQSSSCIPYCHTTSFETYIEAHDPVQLPYRAKDSSNPFWQRKLKLKVLVLMLSGNEGWLVLWGVGGV